MADKPAKAPGAEQTTLRPVRAPVVLIAGGPDQLRAAAQRVAQIESPSIVVETCAAANVASAAASLRPFALVLSRELYGSDRDEFGALARDVQAELVIVNVSSANVAFFEQALRPSLRSAFRRFRTEQQSGPLRR